MKKRDRTKKSTSAASKSAKGFGNRRKAHVKCLVLLSGGLDSRLVCRMMEEQLGKDGVEAVFFALPFGGGCCSDRFCVIKFAQSWGFRLHIIDCTKGAMFRRYMSVIAKPRFGRGVAMNPCIDCHLFMLKEAKKLAKKVGADFLATGEVLGERPLSQHRGALELIEKQAGLEGKVLRPLSAKLLPETEAERNGLVDRRMLLAIHGRGRAGQLELAKRYRMDFPSPGGGCLLTDQEISKRLLRFMGRGREPAPQETELVKLGRHFGRGRAIIIVGRNHQENVKISAIAKELGLPTLEVDGVMGPTTTIVTPETTAARRGQKASIAKRKAQIPKPLCRAAAMLTARYSDAPKGEKCSVCVKGGKKMPRIGVIAPQDNAFLRKRPRKSKVLSRKS